MVSLLVQSLIVNVTYFAVYVKKSVMNRGRHHRHQKQLNYSQCASNHRLIACLFITSERLTVHSVTCRPEDGQSKEFYWFPPLFILPSDCNLGLDRATAPFSERAKRCSGELCYWLQRATTGHRVNMCKRNLVVRCGECCRRAPGRLAHFYNPAVTEKLIRSDIWRNVNRVEKSITRSQIFENDSDAVFADSDYMRETSSVSSAA